MANSENGASRRAAAASARSADADDVISNTYPAAELEVATRLAVTEVELREMKDELKDFMEAAGPERQTASRLIKSSKMKSCEICTMERFDKIKEIESRITALQISAPRSEKHNSWMRIKDLVPEVFSKKEEWKKWRTDVEDYIETFEAGMKAVSKTVAKEKEEIEEEWFSNPLSKVGTKARSSTSS